MSWKDAVAPRFLAASPSLTTAAADAEHAGRLLRSLSAGRGIPSDLCEAGLALQRATRAVEEAWSAMPGVSAGGRG